MERNKINMNLKTPNNQMHVNECHRTLFEQQGNKQGHIPFNLTSTPPSGRIATWQESHGLLQPVFPIM